MLVGQIKLRENLLKQLMDNTLPRFITFVGPRGSQKQKLAMLVAKASMASIIVVEDLSVENIRHIVDISYTLKHATVYIIPNADRMSNAAKNALLKVTEEPPNKARFIMTLEDLNNTLSTIKSRTTVYTMEIFKPEELAEYYCKQYGVLSIDYTQSEVLQIAETPYEIDLLVKYNIYDFISYVHKVMDNIAAVSGANAFKIADKINLKDDNDKYDLKLFWRAFMRVCSQKLLTDIQYYASGIKITSDALSKINITGVNKQMLFDKWLLDIRSAWME